MHSKHKRRHRLRCWLSLHALSCGNSESCQGEHYCLRCGATP